MSCSRRNFRSWSGVRMASGIFPGFATRVCCPRPGCDITRLTSACWSFAALSPSSSRSFSGGRLFAIAEIASENSARTRSATCASVYGMPCRSASALMAA